MNILRKVRIKETSTVDDGDNPGAHILIHKRREPNTEPAIEVSRMNPEILKALGLSEDAKPEDVVKAIEAQKTNATKVADELKAQNNKVTDLEKRIADIEPKEEPEVDEVTKARQETEAIYKAKIADLEAKMEAEADVRKRKESADKAVSVFKHLPEPAKLGELLYDVRKSLGDDKADAIESALKSVDGVAEKSGELFRQYGKGNADIDADADKLETVAKRIQAERGVTIEKARTLALETPEGQAAYEASLR